MPIQELIQCHYLKRLKKQLILFKHRFTLGKSKELLNIFHANQSGADIITVHADILNKLKLINKDLNEYSIETVKMFYNDAQKAGFNI